jgi:hypothetical protein
VFAASPQRLCQQHESAPPDWRTLLRVPGTWAGRIHSATPHPSASSILIFSRWLLLQGLMRDAVLDRYDRFIITRSDYVWLCPHPPLSMLSSQHVWVPDDHHWSGINDRHAVVSRDHVVDFLNGLEDILLRPDELMRDMQQRDAWNDEQLLALHLRRTGLLSAVQEFPYVMYAARPVDDRSPTWAGGRYEPSVGHYVKYESEFRAARAMASLVRSRQDWIRGDWRVAPRAARAPDVSFWRRLGYALDALRVRLLDQVTRPGMVQRTVRKTQRWLRKAGSGHTVEVSAQQYDELSRKRAF